MHEERRRKSLATRCDRLIEEVKGWGIEFPIFPDKATMIRGVGPAMFQELKRRGLICEPPEWLRELPPRERNVVIDLGVQNKAELREKIAGGLMLLKLRNVGMKAARRIEAWLSEETDPPTGSIARGTSGRFRPRTHEPRPMKQSLAQIALVVRDYDEAITFYVGVLGFTLVEDSPVPEQAKRWVVVAPPGSKGCRLLLARAVGDEQSSRIGNQTGGRVFFFLHTDDFWRDYHAYRSRGVVFVREPKEEPYGTVAVFKDLYGNLWDLIQPRG